VLHARRQIVLAAVAALKGAVTGVAGRVFDGRSEPIHTTQKPYLLVYGRQEESRDIAALDDDGDGDGSGGRRLQRALTLAIDGVDKSDADTDAELDALALAVEQALAADPTLGGVARDVVLARTDLNARAEGETRTGRVRLEFDVEYHTAARRPDISI
jgi:hypothetical protein